MSITKNLNYFNNYLSNSVTLVAVSKTKPVADLNAAYEAGQREFGENKVQEMVKKYQEMPQDIKWHMIGHLQSNKVKYIASFVHLIHGVDSLKLLKEINKQAAKHHRKIYCLLQLKIATEDSKFGMSYENLQKLLLSNSFLEMENVKIVGLMGMASFTTNKIKIDTEFKYLKSCFDDLKIKYSNFDILSMGMSGDYEIALKNGSNMIRVGSKIFGSRN